MPMAKCLLAAVNVPEVGIVTLGGENGPFAERTASVELLSSNLTIDGEEWIWYQLPPMLQPRAFPLAAYCKGRIFVTHSFTSNTDLETLPLAPGRVGQWTRISSITTVNDGFHFWSLTTFKERVILAG